MPSDKATESQTDLIYQSSLNSRQMSHQLVVPTAATQLVLPTVTTQLVLPTVTTQLVVPT